MTEKYFKTKSGFILRRQARAGRGGYTIIETMIALSLFLIVVSIGLNALLSASVVQRKSQDIRSIIDNLSFIMEDMSRNIRTGYNYHCFLIGDTIPSSPPSLTSQPKSCASGWALAFESTYGSVINDNDQWLYYISGGKIWKSTKGPYTNPPNFVQLSPDEVVLSSLSSFSVLGAEASSTGDTQQPFVIIRLVGTITYNNVTTPFSLQTSVSQRIIDR